MKIHDYIIVGSGCSGAIVAKTLVDAQKSVLMLDVGEENLNYQTQIPNKDFYDIRTTESQQYKYFIGEHGEGVAWGKVSKGAQVTPTRYHMTKSVDTLIPIKSDNFSPLESLGYGGLGIGWGLQCWRFSEKDIQRCGLNPKEMNEAYEAISNYIGISATKDNAQRYTIGNLKSIMPPPKADRNHREIQKQYKKRLPYFLKKGFFVGRTPLALITKNKNTRKAYTYRDMDFYDDNTLSSWRPWIMVNELRKNKLFTYKNSSLVTQFSENEKHITVHYINTATMKTETIACKKLILASGALGTARIVLRSMGKYNDRLPLLSNPHSYIPCIQPKMFGKGVERHKLGFGQLSYFIDPKGTDEGVSVASSYSYQSLLMFRIINQLPFGYRFGRQLLQFIIPSFTILIAQHPDKPSQKKYVKLIKSDKSPTGDSLFANYELTGAEEKEWVKREKQYTKYLRKLHIFVLKRLPTEHGSAIHYAGTVPFSKSVKSLHLDPSGRLHNTKGVYIADSSGFNYLPAKGVTFSLMANAYITARNIIYETK